MDQSISTKIFNLRFSVDSGQPLTFHADYNAAAGSMRYVTGKGVMDVRHVGNALEYKYYGNYSDSSARNEIVSRFGLKDDLKGVYKSINTDRFMDAAIKSLYGLRVTQNDPWETTLCFIVSQFNNIKRIRLIIKNLIKKYGEDYKLNGKSIKLFPKPEPLSKASIADLMGCGTGFRAKYIKNAAASCHNDLDLKSIYNMDYSEAKKILMNFDGIGDKVADCILLFGYKKLEAFPIDVWIKRSMESTYLGNRRSSVRFIHEFANKKWGTLAGYAQQYLYWYSKTNYRKGIA